MWHQLGQNFVNLDTLEIVCEQQTSNGTKVILLQSSSGKFETYAISPDIAIQIDELFVKLKGQWYEGFPVWYFLKPRKAFNTKRVDRVKKHLLPGQYEVFFLSSTSYTLKPEEVSDLESWIFIRDDVGEKVEGVVAP